MANTTISTANKVTKFQKKVNREYVREGKYGGYIGTGENAIIQSNRSLKETSFPLVAKLSGQGVQGSATLSGNEEALSNFAFKLDPTHYRNAVKVDNEEREKSEFDIFTQGRPSLMNWLMELKRDQISQAMNATQAAGVYYNYGDATAGQLDTWNTNNQDRVAYGSALSNNVAGDHTASLATIDATDDKLTAGTVELYKRMAQNTVPLIRPYMITSDEPMFVYFVDSYGFRDLRNDAVMAQANRDARKRGTDNPIFAGGNLIYDNVVIVEVPSLTKFIDGDGTGSAFDGVWGANSTADSLKTGGASGSRVGVGFFCGAQAIGFLRGKDARFNSEQNDDYGFLDGVAVTAKHDIKKMFYNLKQHGMITTYYSAALDT